MTISSSLAAGVAGLAANANALSATADNIANASTTGYKRSAVEFHSMVVGSGDSRYVAGGVRTSSIKLIDERGPLISSSNATDLAVRGGGFLPVTSYASLMGGASTLPLAMMTTGSFRPDADGYLVATGGQVLMGWPADSEGRIPTFPRDTGQGLEPIRIGAAGNLGEPTDRVGLSLNLPATATEAGSTGDSEVLSVEYYDNLGKPQTLQVTFTPTVPATGASNEWTMTITDDAQGGTAIGEYTLTFNATRTDGGTLLSVVNSGGVAGSTAYDPATGLLQMQLSGGPITLDVGVAGSATGMTQLSDTFAPNEISKNGFPAGNLTSVEVDVNGMVYAYYENGRSQVIYQVPLIDVPNPNGLNQLDSETYTTTIDSGSLFMWNAGDGPVGEVVGFAQEGSTTDIAGELTSLIQTQRAYSSNAKVIQTVDEMLQETTNIKR